MDVEAFKELKGNLLTALNTCAVSCERTNSTDNALKLADACEKLSRAVNYINQLKESEEK